MSTSFIARAKKAIDLKDYETAAKYCDEQLRLDASDSDALRLKAFAMAMRGALDQAIQAIDKVIEITSGSPEPTDYFDRGRWLLEQERFADAISALSHVIDLSARYEDNYYLESAYLYRAVAYGRAASKAEALSDLQHVSQDCTCFALGKVYTKDKLLIEVT